ncbi:uncharacterized protein LOC128858830 [Anastrepha ludens]|uniref:uncharacterized protein LOC128858830 n=1 Tax=Anastrepha ludens TaxID=28586 RepID=UPI0023AEBDA5|nr:uncharacterized protein LOC128858830 [Anastrepha ludens]
MSTMSADYEVVASNQHADISMSVRKKVSIVWRYFEKLDRLRVRCRLCRHEQNYQGTTGNILRHLKNKHNIDATLKGQQANPDLAPKFGIGTDDNTHGRTMYEEDCEIIFLKDESADTINSTSRQPIDNKFKKAICDDSLDPYTDNTFFYNYTDEPRDSNSIRNSTDKQKCSPEEERIIAEIEYFRQKAGYYRMQKNLVALQAKKMKYELERL